jgi:hypothetical protein
MQMSSNRTLSMVMVALAALAFAVAGCKKDKKDEAGTAASAGEAASTDSKGAARPGAPGKAVGNALGLLPSDSDTVVGVNLPQIAKSALWKQFEPMIMAQAGEDYRKFKDKCGLDPMTAVSSVVVGGKAADDQMVVVINGIKRSDFKKCAEAIGDEVSIKEDGKFMTVVSDGEENLFAWSGDDTFYGGPDWTREDLEKVASGGGATANPKIKELLGNVDMGAGLWVVNIGESGGPMGMDYQAAFLSLSFEGGVKLDAGVRLNSAEEAKEAVDMANMQVAGAKSSPFGKYLSTLVIKQNGADVIVQISLSMDEINALMNDPQLQMLGAMMMGQMMQ